MTRTIIMSDKNKARKKKIEAKKQKEQIKKLYPNFLFYNEDCVEPEFCKLVKEALNFLLNPKTIPILNKKSASFNCLYQFMKSMAKKNTHEAAKEFIDAWHSQFDFGKNNLGKPLVFACCIIGDFILNFSEKIKSYIPYSGFVVGIKRGVKDVFYIKFKKVKKYIHDFGSRYKSVDAPYETISGKQYEIIFSTHCITRFQERFTEGSIKLYSQLQFFYTLLEKSRYKLIFNELGGPMLEMYCPVVNEFGSLAKQLSNSVQDLPFLDEEHRKNYCYIHMKYFYLPITIEKDKMVCLTALLPGFKSTPEYKFRKNASYNGPRRRFNSKEEKEIFISKSSSATNFYSQQNAQAFDEKYKDVLMWFHENGFFQFVHASSRKLVNIYSVETDKEISYV